MIVLKHLVGYMAGHAEEFVSSEVKKVFQGCYADMNVMNQRSRSTAMQTGQLTETPDDQFQALLWWMPC